MEVFALFPPQVAQFFRFAAVGGFICTTVLLINVNHVLFDKVLRDSAKKFWWLFVLLSSVPLLVIIFIFDFFFGGKLY